MRPTTPLDTRRLEAWPEIFACASTLEDARALADDTTRPIDERCALLGQRAEGSDDPVLKRSYEAHRKAVSARRFRNWSDLVSYAGFAVAPVAKRFGEASGLGAAARQRLEAYCMAAHLLDLLLHCRDEFHTHDRIFLPGDWMRSTDVAPAHLAAPKASPGLRAVIDRMLDRVDPILAEAFSAAGSIPDSGMRRAAMTEIAERGRIVRRLRRSDPLSGRVDLTALDRAMVWLRVRLPFRGAT